MTAIFRRWRSSIGGSNLQRDKHEDISGQNDEERSLRQAEFPFPNEPLQREAGLAAGHVVAHTAEPRVTEAATTYSNG